MCKINWSNDIVYLPEYWDKRGTLFPIDFDNLPFVPKRIFYISNVPNGTIRGGHGHKNCKQVFICLNGEINVNLKYHKENKYKAFHLTSLQAIYIPNMVWGSQAFYDNGIALVFASEKYNREDYFV